jgi:outer membrane protein TolC
LTLCTGCQNLGSASKATSSRIQISSSQVAASAARSRTTQPHASTTPQDSTGADALILASANQPHGQPGIAGTESTVPKARADLTTAGADYPIDLPTALRLAGANNLQIQFAQHRLTESLARHEGAKVLWLPSLSAGPIYNKHDGRLQETEGSVIEVSRNSAFIGGGPTLSLQLADALFEPLAARQIVRANEAGLTRTTNDTLLAVALAYLDLLQAESQLAISKQDADNAKVLVHLTEAFAKTGQGLESDAARARNELASRQREVIEAEETVRTRSVRLANLLRLDPAISLRPVNTEVTPVVLVSEEEPLADLISQAQSFRPETEEQSALVQAAMERWNQERLRPLVPRLLVDFSAGGFGGGTGSHFANFSDRTDFNVLAVWELRNLGLGNRSLKRQRQAQQLQAETTEQLVQDLIAAEVAEAYHQVHARRRQIEAAEKSVEESLKSLELNMNRIRGAEGLPIEVLQAIQSVATARRAYLATVTNYNRAQFELLRALGHPADSQ